MPIINKIIHVICALFVILCLVSVANHAYADNSDFDILANNTKDKLDDLKKKVDDRNKRLGLPTKTKQIKQNGRDLELTLERPKADKNYPIVPYDPNHPNVIKENKKLKIPAKATTIAKRLGKGFNAAAMGLALAEMLGDGVGCGLGIRP